MIMNIFPLIKKTWQYGWEQLSRHLQKPWVKPRGSDLILTYRCNFQCRHCDIWKETEHQELTTAQWLKIFDNLRQWLGRGYLVSVGGGEPLLRRDILELLAGLTGRGFKVILETNGSLITQAMADSLAQLGLAEVRVSLYSLQPELHNRWRNHPQAHERATRALEMLARAREKFNARFTIGVGLLLHQENIISEALALLRWAGERDYAVTLQALDENFRGCYQDADWFSRNPLWPSDPQEVNIFFDQAVAAKKFGKKITNSLATLESFRQYFINPALARSWPCAVAYRSFNLDPIARPFFCYKTGIAGLSLVKQKPAKMWRSPELRAKRKAMAECAKICRLRGYYRDTLREKIKAGMGA